MEFINFINEWVKETFYPNLSKTENFDQLNCQMYKIDLLNNSTDILDGIVNLIRTKPKELVLLDMKKNQFNLIEKMVYELAIFHISRLGLTANLDLDEICIEYWFKSETKSDSSGIVHEFHVDKDEELYIKNKILKCPILSTVTFLTDSIYPLVISNIKYDDLANIDNLINKQKEFTVIFPKTLTHICFDCKNFHGVVNLDPDIEINVDNQERIVLVFNIWKKYIPLDRKLNTNNIGPRLLNKKTKLLNIVKNTNLYSNTFFIPNKIITKYIVDIVSDNHNKNFYKKNFNLKQMNKYDISIIKSV